MIHSRRLANYVAKTLRRSQSEQHVLVCNCSIIHSCSFAV